MNRFLEAIDNPDSTPSTVPTIPIRLIVQETKLAEGEARLAANRQTRDMVQQGLSDHLGISRKQEIFNAALLFVKLQNGLAVPEEGKLIIEWRYDNEDGPCAGSTIVDDAHKPFNDELTREFGARAIRTKWLGRCIYYEPETAVLAPVIAIDKSRGAQAVPDYTQSQSEQTALAHTG